jgi:hypothetical protein
MVVKKTPEEARGGQKLRRDRYIVPGLLAAAAIALLTVVLVVA